MPSSSLAAMIRRWVFRLTMVVLALGITSIIVITPGPFLGLDFQNLDVFHDCFARDNPYLASGEACGDYLGRHMYYPPLLYWSFAWTRLVSFEIGYVIWAAAIILGSMAAIGAWITADRRDGPTLFFVAVLFFTYPMLFSLERGNNDVIVLVLWTASAWSLMKSRPGLAGLIAGVAVLMKLYPAFAVIVVMAGLLSLPRTGGWPRWHLVRYSLGGIVAAIVLGLPTIGQSLDYVRTSLALMVNWRPGAVLGQHSLTYIAPAEQAWVLTLPLLAVWALAAYRRFRNDPALVLTGALAISTFFSSLSVDYNLITTYPFLVVLFTRATAAGSNLLTVGLLVAGLVAVFGHLAFWYLGGDEAGALAQNWFQWAWLVSAGLSLAWSRITPATAGSGLSVVSPPNGSTRLAIDPE